MLIATGTVRSSSISLRSRSRISSSTYIALVIFADPERMRGHDYLCLEGGGERGREKGEEIRRLRNLRIQGQNIFISDRI